MMGLASTFTKHYRDAEVGVLDLVPYFYQARLYLAPRFHRTANLATSAASRMSVKWDLLAVMNGIRATRLLRCGPHRTRGGGLVDLHEGHPRHLHAQVPVAAMPRWRAWSREPVRAEELDRSKVLPAIVGCDPLLGGRGAPT